MSPSGPAYILLAGVCAFMGLMVSNSILELRRNCKNPRAGRLLVLWIAITEAWCCVWAPAQLALAHLDFMRPSDTLRNADTTVNYGYSVLALVAGFVSFAIGLELACRDRYFGKRLKRMLAMIRSDIARIHFKGNQPTAQLVSVATLLTDLRFIALASFCRAVGCILTLGCSVVSVKVEGQLSFRKEMVISACVLILVASFITTWVSFRVYQWRYKDRRVRVTYYVVVTSLGICIGALCVNMMIVGPSSIVTTHVSERDHAFFRSYALFTVGIGLFFATIGEHIILDCHRLAVSNFVRDVDETHGHLRNLISEEGLIQGGAAMSVQRIDLYRMERFLIASRRLVNKWASNVPIKFDFTVAQESEHVMMADDASITGGGSHYRPNSASHSSPRGPLAATRVVSNKSKVSSRIGQLLPRSLSSDPAPMPPQAREREHSPVSEVAPFSLGNTAEMPDAAVAPMENAVHLSITTSSRATRGDGLNNSPPPPSNKGKDFISLDIVRNNSECSIMNDIDPDPLEALNLTGECDGLFKESALFQDEGDGARDPISSTMSESTVSDVSRALGHDFYDGGELLLASGLQMPPARAQPFHHETTSNSLTGPTPWHQSSMQSLSISPTRGALGGGGGGPHEGVGGGGGGTGYRLGGMSRKVLTVQEEEALRIPPDGATGERLSSSSTRNPPA